MVRILTWGPDVGRRGVLGFPSLGTSTRVPTSRVGTWAFRRGIRTQDPRPLYHTLSSGRGNVSSVESRPFVCFCVYVLYHPPSVFQTSG